MDYAHIATVTRSYRRELKGTTGDPLLTGEMLAQCVITEAVCDEAGELLAAAKAVLAGGVGAADRLREVVSRIEEGRPCEPST